MGILTLDMLYEGSLVPTRRSAAVHPNVGLLHGHPASELARSLAGSGSLRWARSGAAAASRIDAVCVAWLR